MMPITAPMTTAMHASPRAIASENVMPYQIRDSTSRPVPGSRPSGWSQLIPPKLPLADAAQADVEQLRVVERVRVEHVRA